MNNIIIINLEKKISIFYFLICSFNLLFSRINIKIKNINNYNFKNRIIPKIKNAIASLTKEKHQHIQLSDFNSIQRKKLGKNFIFFNNAYKDVSHNYLKILFNK